MRIIVLGYIVRCPLAGLAWHHLQYALGLLRLGHDVYFFEDSADIRDACYDPARDAMVEDPSYGLRFAADVFTQFQLADRWAYYDSRRREWEGPCADHAVSLAESADIVLNVSGVNPLRPWLANVPRRVLIDTDPVFTQVRHLTGSQEIQAARLHNAFFTFGENLGTDGCLIPEDGLPWLPTRQPVVLEEWTVSPGPRDGALTTVMVWDPYPPRTFHGTFYGTKSHSFEEYFDLPAATEERLELAIGGPGAPRDRLVRCGWLLRNPVDVTRDLQVYAGYIKNSKAEFSVAKHGYVVSHSGWFSERSAVYLASGRPVIVQETGFSRWMAANSAVLAFRNHREALSAIQEVNTDYEIRCRTAREIAREYFSYDRVLNELLDRL